MRPKACTKLDHFWSDRTTIWLLFIVLLNLVLHPSTAYGQDFEETNDDEQIQQHHDADAIRTGSAKSVRHFHEVLNELLTEFGYDIRTGQIKGLENLAMRRAEVSEALPHSYKKYIKLLINERLMDNAQIKMIHCIPCESRTSKIVEGKFVITSPSTNISELKIAAQRLGITNFMDIILVYHSTHMVLAVQIFDVQSNELVWNRSYNSETIRSRFQKLAVDYNQVKKSRESDEYQPEFKILIGAGAGIIPNVGGDEANSSMLSLEVRSTEKFNNRHSEFGMLLTIYSATESLLSEHPVADGTGDTTNDSTSSPSDPDQTNPAQPEPFTTGILIGGVYSHNFLGSIESYDAIRQGVHIAAGGFFATGYMAGAARIGWDLYFGRRYVITVAGLYLAPSKILLDSTLIETKGGEGFEAIMSYNF